MVTGIQTYGQLGNWNPHLYSLCTDGCFDSEGNFYPLPHIPEETLEKIIISRDGGNIIYHAKFNPTLGRNF